jgi:hypothetical protein
MLQNSNYYMTILNKTKKTIWVGAFVSVLFLSSVFLVIPGKVSAVQPRIDLLTTDGFVVLGGSAISDTPTSVINGNVGLDPTGGASITGLTCSEMTGTIYDNDAGYAGGGTCRITDGSLLTTAKDDLTKVYNQAVGRTTTSTIPTELGGSTLTDGVYDSAAGTFGLTGTLTLNGGGNPDSVFIFKAASTLITASASKVVLTNGAQACNVYWQVGSSTTLGTGSTLVGNVITLTSITDDGSSTVLGRLLARNGAVTLSRTTVSKQTCAGVTPTPTLTTTPTPTITLTTTPSSSSNISSINSSYESCPPLNDAIATPIVIESKRIDADSIFIKWGPYSGVNTFNVQYGFENGNWLYNFDTTDFSATINNLHPNQPIWVRIANRNDCFIGTYGESKLVGGPGMPNTGFAPKNNKILWCISLGILTGASVILVLAQKKYRFLSKH